MMLLNDGDLLLERNKNLVRSFFERANTIGGTPVDMVTEDFVAHISGAQPYDLKAFEDYQESFYSSFSETETVVEDLIAEGDRVAFRGYVRTVHTGEFMGVPASGKEIVVSVIGFAKIEQGKIAEWWNFPDRLSWMQQIGALPERVDN
ncbi:hypothetical protein GF319_11425 [Candidatus Bathyarchaeota archaeon]|nr:hypothetical protein [Candidatus Bathyarchaeota archaeon]